MWSLVSVLCILCVALGLSCSDDEPTKPDNGTPDTTPPAAVSDLAAGSPTARSITLTWTAVGDDSLSGTADRYDIRYTADSLATWEDMTVVSDPPDPKPAGDAESFVVTGLEPITTYHFQMKAADEVPNWSGLSNRASAATDGEDPGTGMIWIPAGNVRLGQVGDSHAEPVHDVWVDGFWIGKYEVTNGEYAAFIAAGGYTTEAYWNPVGWAWRVENDITMPENWDSNQYHGGGIPGNEQFPVNGVSWWEADAYCRWAGKRLPTEAEWEKAAKGPSPNTPTYPWGASTSGTRANHRDSGDPWDNNTTPVGFYDGRNHQGFQTVDSPSPYGLYDVAGNVYEWTSTKYASYPYDPDDGRENPPASEGECCRVLRGGSWRNLTHYLRCANRYYGGDPYGRNGTLGFRCARTVNP